MMNDAGRAIPNEMPVLYVSDMTVMIAPAPTMDEKFEHVMSRTFVLRLLTKYSSMVSFLEKYQATLSISRK